MNPVETARASVTSGVPVTLDGGDEDATGEDFQAELMGVLGGLWASGRAKPLLRDYPLTSERLAELLERAEGLVADRLADQG